MLKVVGRGDLVTEVTEEELDGVLSFIKDKNGSTEAIFIANDVYSIYLYKELVESEYLNVYEVRNRFIVLVPYYGTYEMFNFPLVIVDDSTYSTRGILNNIFKLS